MSSLNSWGAYILAAAALVALLAPALGSTAAASREGADWRTVDGVRQALSSLGPGMTVTFVVGPGADSLMLTGRAITCSYGGGTVSAASPWPLPNMTLSPGVAYSVSLSGGSLRVRAVG